MSANPELMTITEAAERLRRSRSTVFRWIADGTLPAANVGKGLYIRSADLDAMINTDRKDAS